MGVSEQLYTGLASHPRVTIERIPNGTNLTRLVIKGDGAAVARRLAAEGIVMPAPSAQGVAMLGVNETWTRRSAAELVRAFEQALA